MMILMSPGLGFSYPHGMQVFNEHCDITSDLHSKQDNNKCVTQQRGGNR